MCLPLLKMCSWVIAQFNSLWCQRLTSVAFPCVLTQDAYHRLRNLRRVFLRFRTVFSFRSIRGFISFGKRRIFLTRRWKNWCQEISAYKLVNKPFKVVFLTLLAGVQNMCEIVLIQWLQFRNKLLIEQITLIQRINGCPAIRNIGPQCVQNRWSVGSSRKESKRAVSDCSFNNIQASVTASCSKSV